MTGSELRDIRGTLGWTQEKMALHLGCSHNHLALLERGQRPIKDGTARYATVLHLAYRQAVVLGLIEPRSPLH
jgi:transcriptional regulator with XRE-family HTH domain